MFLKIWLRRSAQLRYDWDLDDDKALGYKTQTRPQYSGPPQAGFYSEGVCIKVSDRVECFTGGWVDVSSYENVVPNKFRSKREAWSNRFFKSIVAADDPKLIVRACRRWDTIR